MVLTYGRGWFFHMHDSTEPGESSLVDRLMIQLGGGVARTLRTAGDEVARHFGASEMVLVIRWPAGCGGLLWRCSGHTSSNSEQQLEHLNLSDVEAAAHFGVPDGDWILTHRPHDADNGR